MVALVPCPVLGWSPMSTLAFDAPTPCVSDADLSACGTYRYRLTRQWADRLWGVGTATFIMLNPSIADAGHDDPTVRRCVGYAKAWGADGLTVVNLYALVATDHRDLWKHPDPVGPENDDWLVEAAQRANVEGWPLVAAWGANARPDRVERVLNLLGSRKLTALGVTKAGAPRHPVRLRSDAARAPWPVEVTA